MSNDLEIKQLIEIDKMERNKKKKNIVEILSDSEEEDMDQKNDNHSGSDLEILSKLIP